MFQQPFGMPAHDPIATQIPHETLNVIQDIESRLLALKIGIAQTNPQLAPVLLWREQALATLSARVPMWPTSVVATPQTVPTGIPTQGPIASAGPLTGFPSLDPVTASLINLANSIPNVANLRVPGVLPNVSPFAPSFNPVFGAPLTYPSGVVHPYGIATPFRY